MTKLTKTESALLARIAQSPTGVTTVLPKFRAAACDIDTNLYALDGDSAMFQCDVAEMEVIYPGEAACPAAT